MPVDRGALSQAMSSGASATFKCFRTSVVVCVSTTKWTCGRVSSGWVLTVTFSAIVRSFRLSPLICLGLKLCLLLHIVGFQVFYLSLILSGPTGYRERDP